MVVGNIPKQHGISCIDDLLLVLGPIITSEVFKSLNVQSNENASVDDELEAKHALSGFVHEDDLAKYKVGGMVPTIHTI